MRVSAREIGVLAQRGFNIVIASAAKQSRVVPWIHFWIASSLRSSQ